MRSMTWGMCARAKREETARVCVRERERERERRDQKTRGRATDLDARRDIFCAVNSSIASRGVASVARARIIRRGGGQGDGEEEGVGQGASARDASARARETDEISARVQVHPEGKYVCDMDKSIDVTKLTPGTRVALRNDSYTLHVILPSNIDPLVSLMKVEKVPDSTFDMIGGLDQQVKEIKEVVELPIKHPELFDSLGIAQPKGVILYGPPGTGKTLLARAVAHHTDCCFIRVSGSELVQKYIGEGARMVRELFVMAREHAPSILFMDEVDSIGSARDSGGGGGGGDSEVQRTMLELLNQLDGFEATNKIKVIMATNRLDILDQALLRPGRIDRKIEFPNPSEDSRVDILKIHSRKMNLVRGIDLKKIASKMNGASGAESKAVCTEAGMFALRERRVHVTQEDFEMAVSKVMQKDSEKNISVKKLFS